MGVHRYSDTELGELGETLGELRALMTAVHAEYMEVLGAFIESEACRIDGMPDTTSWLTARSNLSRVTARHEVDIATRAPEIPALMDAWRQGRISWDQLLVLAPVATPETDADLAETAPGWTYHRSVLQARALRPVPAEDAAAQHRDRFVQLLWQRDSTLKVRGRLSGEQATIVETTLNRLVDALGEQGRFDEDGRPIRRDARRADVLVKMCEADPQVLAQSPTRPLVVVHVGAERLAHDDDPHDPAGRSDAGGVTGDTGASNSPDGRGSPGASWGTAEPPTIGGGWAISGATARRLACDCRWQVVAHDASGHTIGISRESRRIPAWLARVVNHRDQHRCRWPKCDRTVWLEIHHVEHWARLGPSDENNLVNLCWHHHHLVHEGRWHMTIDPSTRQVTIYRPDMSVYSPPLEPVSLSDSTREWLAQTGGPSPVPPLRTTDRCHDPTGTAA
jgi:Domain of unknown function (DUF222)